MGSHIDRHESAVSRARFILLGAAGFASLGAALAGCAPGADKTPAVDDGDIGKTPDGATKYRLLRTIATGLSVVRGLDVDDAGHVMVAGDAVVSVYTRDGLPVRAFKVAAPPVCVHVGPHGRTYVSLGDRVQVLGEDGASLGIWNPPGEDAVLTAIAADTDRVYVADAGARLVYMHGADGKLRRHMCGKDVSRDYPGLIVPSPHLDVAVGSAGTLYVSNPGRHRIETYDSAGDPLGEWGAGSSEPDGFCGCCNPTDFCLLPAGRVVTSEKGVPRVKLYSRDGKYEGFVAGAETFAAGSVGLDLAAFGDGTVAVLDPKAKAVRLYVHV